MSTRAKIPQLEEKVARLESELDAAKMELSRNKAIMSIALIALKEGTQDMAPSDTSKAVSDERP